MSFCFSRNRNWEKGIILSITLIFSFLCHPVFGEPISQDLAKRVGLTQVSILERNMAHKGVLTPAAARTVAEVSTLFGQQSQPLAYVINLNPKGYVVISPDTYIPPVIAYSADGKFPFEESKENVLLHLVVRDMENRLKAIPELSEVLKEKNRLAWAKYLENDENWLRETSEVQQWGPWVNTNWHQNEPYNKYCPGIPFPSDPDKYSRCPVGCLATALAQIINYWEYPSSVNFDESDCYQTRTKEINIDEDFELYDFPNFEELNNALELIDYSNEDDIAALNFAVGISARMDYALSGSAAILTPSILTNKFGYASAGLYNYVGDLFYVVLQKDIKRGRPAALSLPTHGIVADGYKETGEYHLNYGWGGSSNGWYFLEESQTIVRGILYIFPYNSNNVFYVDADITNSGDGQSWENAVNSIQAALSLSSPTDEIWVKKGEYLIESSISINQAIGIYGGFAGWETMREQRDSDQNPTIVDGQNLCSCFNIINASGEVTIDGIKIIKGRNAIINIKSSPIIKNCIFENNNGHNGGAIYN
jgi:hypothetical protein